MLIIYNQNIDNYLYFFWKIIKIVLLISLIKKIKLKHPILITGAAGFIGSNLVRYFVSKRIKVNILLKKNSNIWRIQDIIKKVNVFYLDISDSKKLKKIIQKIKPKTIFHLATHGAYSNQKDLFKIKESIFDATFNLVQECKKYKFHIFINTGSSSEYGFKTKKMKESDNLIPNSYYSAFKSSASLFCQYESIKSKLPIITIRPFHVYGPYEERSRLVPVMIDRMLKNKKIKLVSPKITRDMIYIEDVINFYIKIANRNKYLGEIFNLGVGKKITIKKIYETIKKIINYKKKNLWRTMKNRNWDQITWYSDMSYTKSKIDWKPKYNLKKGLEKTIKWHKNFYE